MENSKFNHKNLFAVIAYSLADLFPRLGCLKAANTLHRIFLRTVLRLPMKFFDTTLKGALLSRFSKDIEIIDNRLSKQLDNVVFFTLQVKAQLRQKV